MNDIDTIPNYRAGVWTVDPETSTIAFSVRQLMVTKTQGRFRHHDVTIVTGDNPLAATVTATIDLASIDTGNHRRDNHLRTAEFFDVANHPTMSYRSTGVRPASAGWLIDGDLTLHGVTRTVPLAVEVCEFGLDQRDRSRFRATAQLRRSDFGIDRWTGGGAVVSDQVSIHLQIEAVRQR